MTRLWHAARCAATPPSMRSRKLSTGSQPSSRNTCRRPVSWRCSGRRRGRRAASISMAGSAAARPCCSTCFSTGSPSSASGASISTPSCRKCIPRIFAIRQGGQDRNGDAVVVAARDIAAEARLVCLDEFQVNDIADAMILGRLFEAVLGAGTVIVLTSNVRARRSLRERPQPSALPAVHPPDRGAARCRRARRQHRLSAGARRWRAGLFLRRSVPMPTATCSGCGSASPTPIAASRSTLSVKVATLSCPRRRAGAARFGFADLCAGRRRRRRLPGARRGRFRYGLRRRISRARAAGRDQCGPRASHADRHAL